MLERNPTASLCPPCADQQQDQSSNQERRTPNAAYVHWNQDSAELRDWQAAHRRLVEDRKLSKVYHPSPAQVAKQIAEPKPTRSERTLKPA
jgi:hypothetical protein